MTETSLKLGIEAVKAGRKDNARQLLAAAIKQDPNSEQAWGWFYNVCNNDEERTKCLKEVLRINPSNEVARKKLADLSAKESGLNYQSPEIAQAQQKQAAAQQRIKNLENKRNLLGGIGKTGCLLMVLGIALILVVVVVISIFHP